MTSKSEFLGLSLGDQWIFEEILNTIPYSICAFGSRVTEKYKKLSDIDLCIMENINDLTLFEIKEKFAESDLPMKVDIKRWNDMNVTFQQLIKKNLKPLK